MKILLKNTTSGLIPMYDSDYDEKKRLKIGEVYEATIKKVRNLQFHKLYFALINCAWEYQNEERQLFFNNSIEKFRKSLEVSAGYCETVFNIKLKTWVDIPKSVSFDKMDNLEFGKLYEDVRAVLFSTFLTHIPEDEFNENLINF